MVVGLRHNPCREKNPPPIAPFVGGEREANALRSVVKILVHPEAPTFGSGVIVSIDRTRYPKLLRDGEVAVLTAAHVANNLRWDRKLAVECIEFRNGNGQKMITFSESFPARVVMIAPDHHEDVALLAASIPKERFEKGLAKEATFAVGDYPFQLREELLAIGCAGGNLPTCKKIWVGNLDGSSERSYIHVSDPCATGESGGPALNAEGKVVALCSATLDVPENIALGWRLQGPAAEQATASAQLLSRQWGIYCVLTHLDELLGRGNREAEALRNLELALLELERVRGEK